MSAIIIFFFASQHALLLKTKKTKKKTSFFPFTEDNWRVIQKYATKILTEYAEKKLAFQLEGKCDFQPRFSFTRSLSQVEYATQKKKMSLKDGAEAIYVCDVLDEVSSDDVFHDPK